MWTTVIMCVLSVPDRGLQEKAFSYGSIYGSYIKCRRNKRNSVNALRFEINAEENVLKLERELRCRSYRPSRSILFAAQKPKVREIFAADFRDRVVHHVLIARMEKIWNRLFIHDSYACRDGKGTHAAVKRMQSFMRKITVNGNVRAYYLQLDIKDFFISINKKILFDLVRSRITDPDILWLAQKIIFSDCTADYVLRGSRQSLLNIPENKSLFGKNNERGLPIGNLTSQFFANIYLNELDQFIKHKLRVKLYMRYVDDFVLLSRDPDHLKNMRDEIGVFLAERLKLKIHPRRQKIAPVSSGIDFLGYIVRPEYILVRRRVLNNLKTKLREYKRDQNADLLKIQATIASYRGHLKHANSYRITKNIDADVEMITTTLGGNNSHEHNR